MKCKHFVVILCLCVATILAAASAQGMTFTDSSGNNSTITFNSRPEARFDFNPKVGPAPLWVTFQNRSRFETNIEWLWEVSPCVDYEMFNVNFDDAKTVSAQVIPYFHPGTYVVYLAAENSVGTDVEVRFVEVTEPMPFGVSFVSYNSRTEEGEPEVTFIPNVPYSDFMSFAYIWNFGDGTGSGEASPDTQI